MWFQLKSAALPIMLWVCVSLAACTHQEPVATLETQAGTISLQRIKGDGSFVVTVTPHTMLQLNGYTEAGIASIWNAKFGQLLVIAGSGVDCSSRYTLVVVTAVSASAVPIGECGETFTFTQAGETFAIRQISVRPVKLWTFSDGVLHGPITEHTRNLRPTRRAARLRSAGSAADPTLVPSISAPVGEEVVPSPLPRTGSPDPQP